MHEPRRNVPAEIIGEEADLGNDSKNEGVKTRSKENAVPDEHPVIVIGPTSPGNNSLLLRYLFHVPNVG